MVIPERNTRFPPRPLLFPAACCRSPQVELRAANEIDEAVAHALRSSAERSSMNGAGSALGGDRGGTLAPAPPVSRPVRPGRGRARLTKRAN